MAGGSPPAESHGRLVPSGMDQKARIKWWEPYKQTLKSSLADLRSTGVLRPMFWIRVIALSSAVVVVVVALMLRASPGMWLPWPQLAAGLLIGPAALALVITVSMLAPRHVEVRRNWIQFTRGQSAVRIPAPNIVSIALVQHGTGGLRLRLVYVTRRGVQRTSECAVPPAVDRGALEAIVSQIALMRPKACTSSSLETLVSDGAAR